MRVAKVENDIVSEVTIANDLNHSADWLMANFGGTWVNVPDEKNVGVGYKYRKDLGDFIPPSPQKNWIFNDASYEWEPPVPIPDDGQDYVWDESVGEWVVAE